MKNIVENQDIKTDKTEMEGLRNQLAAVVAENTEMRSVIDAAVAVAGKSDGIAGWHLNGEIAGWDEILPELNIETLTTDATLHRSASAGSRLRELRR